MALGVSVALRPQISQNHNEEAVEEEEGEAKVISGSESESKS